MANESPRPNSRRWKLALTIRARLMIVAVIAILPLLLDRIRDIEADRADRIEAASHQALALARQGMAVQNEALVSVRAFLQVTASAHGFMTSRGERCDSYLADAVRQVSWLKSLSFVEPDGRIICSSNADVVGVDISHLPHFKRATQTGEFALSDYFVGKVVGPTLFSAMPHKAAGGKIDVVVSAPLELSWFDGVASSFARSSGSVVMMVDGAGTLLARQPVREGLVGRRFSYHPVIRAILAQREGTFTGESLDGVRRIYGFVQLPGTSARLAVGLDEGEVMRRANHEIMLSLAGLLLMTGIVLAAIWFGGEKFLVEPIRALTRIAQRIGDGDFSARASQLPWAPEYVPLAAALDDMAGQLKSREQELRDSNGQLRELAYIDGLTGISNRRAFNARLASEWQLAVELRQPLAVVLLDVDHFKLFNDRYGHLKGDVCLRTICDVLTAGSRVRDTARHAVAAPPSFQKYAARNPDFIARFGGEEFAVLLQGDDLDAAMLVAERLRRAVEDLRMTHDTAPRGLVTISIGVAATLPGPGDSAQRLVEAADAGLYEAKRRGRNMVVAHCESVLAQAS
jgi:GGDEF domain-containing protein